MDPQIAARVLLAIPVLVVLLVVVSDIILEWKEWPSISERIQTWTGENPLLGAGLTLVLGAVVGHFLFWPH